MNRFLMAWDSGSIQRLNRFCISCSWNRLFIRIDSWSLSSFDFSFGKFGIPFSSIINSSSIMPPYPAKYNKKHHKCNHCTHLKFNNSNGHNTRDLWTWICNIHHLTCNIYANISTHHLAYPRTHSTQPESTCYNHITRTHLHHLRRWVQPAGSEARSPEKLPFSPSPLFLT